MNFIPLLFMAISSNLDNLGIGISYGTRKIQLSFTANLIIAFITSAGTFVSLALGGYISSCLSVQTASGIGSFIIIAAGIWVLWLGRPELGKEASLSGEASSSLKVMLKCLLLDHSQLTEILKKDGPIVGAQARKINDSEAIVLGVALMMNNISAGIGGGMVGMNPIITTVMVFILSIVTLWFGFFCGTQYASRWLNDKAWILSGWVLIMIGMYEFFG